MFRTSFLLRLGCSAVATALAMPAAASEAEGSNPPQADLPGLPGILAPKKPAAALTPAEQRMRQDKDRFNKTLLGGVATGAAIGAGAAWLATVIKGGDAKQQREALLGGGVLGGIAGGVNGYVTAKKEQAGREKISELQAATADVRQGNAQLQAFIDGTTEVLNEGRTRLVALSSDVAAKRVSAREAELAWQREEKNIEEMKATLENARKDRDQHQQAGAQFTGTPADRRDLDAEIARRSQQVTQLEATIAEYSRALTVSKA